MSAPKFCATDAEPDDIAEPPRAVLAVDASATTRRAVSIFRDATPGGDEQCGRDSTWVMLRQLERSKSAVGTSVRHAQATGEKMTSALLERIRELRDEVGSATASIQPILNLLLGDIQPFLSLFDRSLDCLFEDDAENTDTDLEVILDAVRAVGDQRVVVARQHLRRATEELALAQEALQSRPQPAPQKRGPPVNSNRVLAGLLLLRLRDRDMTIREITDLVLSSCRDWLVPPCPSFVDHYLEFDDDIGPGEGQRALIKFMERLESDAKKHPL